MNTQTNELNKTNLFTPIHPLSTTFPYNNPLNNCNGSHGPHVIFGKHLYGAGSVRGGGKTVQNGRTKPLSKNTSLKSRTINSENS